VALLSLLVVDDEDTVRESLVDYFTSCGHHVRGASTLAEARRAVAAHAPHVALVDLRLPDAAGVEVMRGLRAEDPELPCIVLTGHADVGVAVQAMQEGAVDLLEKPVDLPRLLAAVVRAAEAARSAREVAVLRTYHETIARPEQPPLAPALDRLIALAARNHDAPVLLTGETGTGKGYVARLIHERSSRADQPYVAINAATLNTTFLASELFGHEKGAFTDARSAKRGLLEVAGDGTVFLDEIAELPLDAQPKLLQVLEARTYRRMGGTTEMRTSARIVAATNADLNEAVGARRFRADLYYRLQVLSIALPPLRARLDELPSLAATLLPRGAHLSARAERALAAYHWPGNIRELGNTLWRAAILADGSPIGVEHLSLPAPDAPAPKAESHGTPSLAEAERAAIVAALDATNGNKSKAAEVLGIARSTLNEKAKRYRL
jgi:DNA-binding NtrC family response regulator